MGGCFGAFDHHRLEIRTELETGDYDLIAQDLDDPAIRATYDDGNELLWALDRGSVALALDDAPTAIDVFNQAETTMDTRRRQHPAETLAAILISDRLTPYLGEPYEDIYVNVMKMLAHLEEGRIQGGATVEARRLATKVDLLRDEYLSQEGRIQFMSRQPGGTAQIFRNNPVATTSNGEFIDSTLGTYLTAVTYLYTGDRANQAVAARRLREAIEAEGDLLSQVDVRHFKDLGSREPEDANVLVVALSGQSPEKRAEAFGPLIIDGTPIYFELPVLRNPIRQIVAARVVDEPLPAGPRHNTELHLIEDLGLVAYENHRRQLPLTYLRTVLRAMAKSIAIRAVQHAAREEHDRRPETLATISGLLLLAATERADLRGWTLLPGQAHVGLLSLSPGRHRLTVEFLDSRGTVIFHSPSRDIMAGARPLTTLVEHCWK